MKHISMQTFAALYCKHCTFLLYILYVVYILLGYLVGVPLLCLHIMITVATRIATQANLLEKWSTYEYSCRGM